MNQPPIGRAGVIFSLAVSLSANLLYGVNSLLGQGVLLNLIAGRYRRPRIEERVLMFIDMESSTAIAERLGEAGFLDFLNRFVADITAPTWPLAAGLHDGRCIRAGFDAMAQLDAFADTYIRGFGRRANFRAALHCGPVVIGELGLVKMEIALLGDAVNTVARIQQTCRDTGHRVLASAALLDRLSALQSGCESAPNRDPTKR